MKCDWTQKVSLLFDGELAGAETREVEDHLAACGDCREAQADFLLLRRQIAAHQINADAFAENRALKNILAAGASGTKFEDERSIAQPRRRRRAGFAGVFGMPRLSPVGLAALSLLLIGIALGVVSLFNVRRAPVEMVKTDPTPVPDSNVKNNSTGNASVAPPATPNQSTAGINNRGERIAGNQPKGAGSQAASDANRNIKDGAREIANKRRVENASRETTKQFSSPKFNQPKLELPVAVVASNEGEAVGNGREEFESGEDALQHNIAGANVTATSKTERHVEQAQLLLRSFRNARPAEPGGRASSDLAHDKRQSKKLLYQNIVLRREAAGRGNLPVESLLDSLEPILIDIANLPDRPAPADVREINERMRRKNLVAMLQISSVESASARN